MEYRFEAVVIEKLDEDALEKSAQVVNDCASGDWEVVALVPTP
jgi:hypothetical protein